MGDPNVTELVVRGKQLTDEAFAKVSANLKRIKGDVDAVNKGASFGQIEGSLRKFDDVLQLAGGPNLRDLIQGVGQLGDVSESGAGKLGLLAKAGLVASAAMGGWQIGRKIAELTGTDTLIGNATAKLMGWGDAAGQAAAAGADVLARASKNAGRQITDMTEAIKINEQAATSAADAIQRKSAPAAAAADLAKWRGELDKLRSDGLLDDLRKNLESQNYSQEELRKRYNVSSQAIQIFSRELGTEHKALEKATAASDAHAEQIRKLADAYRGVDAIERAKEAIEALHSAQRQGVDINKMTIEQQKALGKTVREAIDVYEALGKRVPPELHAIALATHVMSASQVQDLENVTAALGKMEQGILRIPHAAFEDWTWATRSTLSSRSIPELTGMVQNFNDHDNTGSMPKNITTLGRIFGSSRDFGAQMAGTILGAIQGGGNPVTAAAGQVGGQVAKHIATELTTEGGKYIKGALGGIISAGLPVVGSLIGPLMGKVFSGIKDKFFGTKGRDAVKDFAESVTGSTDLNALNAFLQEKLPASADRFWKALTQGVGRNNAGQAKQVIDEVTAALAKQQKQQDDTAAAAARKADAVAEAEQKAAAAVAAVQSKIADVDKQVAQWDAAEAVEENMGLTEKAARESLAAQRAALEQELKATQDQGEASVQALKDASLEAFGLMTDAVNNLADALRGIPAETHFTVNGHYAGPRGEGDEDSDIPSHDRGAYIREDHVARVHAGEMIGEQNFFGAAIARALVQGGFGQREVVVPPVILTLDGRQIAQATVRHIPDQVTRYGRGSGR